MEERYEDVFSELKEDVVYFKQALYASILVIYQAISVIEDNKEMVDDKCRVYRGEIMCGDMFITDEASIKFKEHLKSVAVDKALTFYKFFDALDLLLYRMLRFESCDEKNKALMTLTKIWKGYGPKRLIGGAALKSYADDMFSFDVEHVLDLCVDKIKDASLEDDAHALKKEDLNAILPAPSDTESSDEESEMSATESDTDIESELEGESKPEESVQPESVQPDVVIPAEIPAEVPPAEVIPEVIPDEGHVEIKTVEHDDIKKVDRDSNDNTESDTEDELYDYLSDGGQYLQDQKDAEVFRGFF